MGLIAENESVADLRAMRAEDPHFIPSYSSDISDAIASDVSDVKQIDLDMTTLHAILDENIDLAKASSDDQRIAHAIDMSDHAMRISRQMVEAQRKQMEALDAYVRMDAEAGDRLMKESAQMMRDIEAHLDVAQGMMEKSQKSVVEAAKSVAQSDRVSPTIGASIDRYVANSGAFFAKLKEKVRAVADKIASIPVRIAAIASKTMTASAEVARMIATEAKLSLIETRDKAFTKIDDLDRAISVKLAKAIDATSAKVGAVKASATDKIDAALVNATAVVRVASDVVAAAGQKVRAVAQTVSKEVIESREQLINTFKEKREEILADRASLKADAKDEQYMTPMM